MDISPTIHLTCLKMYIHIYETCLEGRGSQTVYIGLSFILKYAEEGNLEKQNPKKSQKFFGS